MKPNKENFHVSLKVGWESVRVVPGGGTIEFCRQVGCDNFRENACAIIDSLPLIEDEAVETENTCGLSIDEMWDKIIKAFDKVKLDPAVKFQSGIRE